jgi:hypothetical protein
VLENGGDEKNWLDPPRSQLRNFKFTKRDGRSDEERDWGVIAIARSDKRRRAGVLDLVRVRMDALVELGGDA